MTDNPVTDVIDELQWRGLIVQSTGLDELREHLNSGSRTFYAGFDPSAPSIHFGNLLIVVIARHLQRAGHRPICLVGGSTGLVGDPKDTGEREMSDAAQVADRVERIRSQIAPLLDFEGTNAAIMVNNLDWTGPMSVIDYLRDVGKHYRVNVMIKKDLVARRLESEQGISYAEFSYQILQGMDYRHLLDQYGCSLQIGGQDQWGNLISGVELIHYTRPGADVHALTAPLLTDSTGRKFGKSEGNAVWIDPEMTSPYAWYQYFLNIEDASVVTLLKALTDLPRERIEELAAAVAERPFAREAQRALAENLTVLVHGEAALRSAQAASDAVFGKGDLTALDEGTLVQAVAELPGAEVAEGISVTDALIAVGLAESRNAARRLIADGGVSVNGAKVSEPEESLGAEAFLHNRFALLRRGRRAQAVARKAV